MLLSPPTEAAILTILAHIQANTTRNDPIYVYPQMPLLYLMSDRRPSAFSPIHHIDVTPDSVAISDAAKLRRHPPKVIVYQVDNPESITRLEQAFRGGRASGQRQLSATLASLRPRYDIAYHSQTNGQGDAAIEVWVLRDAQDGGHPSVQDLIVTPSNLTAARRPRRSAAGSP